MQKSSLEISKSQQRHTMMAKKKKPQAMFKNILAQPFPRYWPQIDETQCQQLFAILKHIRETSPGLFSTKKSEKRRPITYGLRASLQKLKHGCANTLLISADLKPRYVINQIILLALARNESIRILCVPNLAVCLKELVDFSCFALVIGNDTSHAFEELIVWCDIIIAKHHPVPALIRSHFIHRHKKTNTESSIEMGRSHQADVADTSASDNFAVKDLYLLTASCVGNNRRAFVPKNAINLKPLSLEITSLDKIKSDFISLDTYDNNGNGNVLTSKLNLTSKNVTRRKSDERDQLKLCLSAYQALKIHKIQGNVNKAKGQKSSTNVNQKQKKKMLNKKNNK